MRLAITVAAVLTVGASAEAQPKKLSRIAVGAVGEIGATAANDKLVAALEKDIVNFGLGEVIATRQIKRAIKRAKKPQLAACEGDEKCLAEMGRTVGAELVIGAEVGGLGDVQVVHLRIIRSKDGAQLRSVTSNIANGRAEEAKLVELLAPRRYRGALTVNSKVEGAQIIVNAKAIGKTPAQALPLSVGSHALRITHPDYRDLVRFIDIEYGKTVSLDVDLVALGVSEKSLEREGGAATGITTKPGKASKPWYARWYVIAGIGAVVLGGSIAIWASQPGDVGADHEVPLP